MRRELVAIDPDPWWERANCRGRHELFFPANDGGAAGAIRKALLFCACCPVRTECAEAGENESFGIWGGVSKQSGLTESARTQPPRLAVCLMCGAVFPAFARTRTCSTDCYKARRRELERESYGRRKRVPAEDRERRAG